MNAEGNPLCQLLDPLPSDFSYCARGTQGIDVFELIASKRGDNSLLLGRDQIWKHIAFDARN